MAIRNWTQEQRQLIEDLVKSEKYTQYSQIAEETGLLRDDIRNYISNRPYLLKIIKPETYETKRKEIAEAWDL